MPAVSTHASDKPFVIGSPALVTRDDFSLGATLYEPKQAACGTVIIHGATATPSRFYRRFSEFLAHHGLRVLTYDYRGVGLSRPASLRGFRARLTDWALSDAEAAHAYVARTFPSEPVAMVGHSFGGQLIGLLDTVREVRAAVLVASQLGYYGHWAGLDRLRLGLLWYAVVPTLTASFGYLPGKAGLGEDLPRGVAEEWARWCASPEYLISHHPEARERFARFDRPTLFFSFEDDDYAPGRAVSALLEVLSSATLDHRRIVPAEYGKSSIGHFGFFRARFEQTLWLETLHFLKGGLHGEASA